METGNELKIVDISDIFIPLEGKKNKINKGREVLKKFSRRTTGAKGYYFLATLLQDSNKLLESL